MKQQYDLFYMTPVAFMQTLKCHRISDYTISVQNTQGFGTKMRIRISYTFVISRHPSEDESFCHLADPLTLHFGLASVCQLLDGF